jgi:hypothetical protein
MLRFRLATDHEADCTSFGELDRVAAQVVEDLLEARGIRAECPRQRRYQVDLVGQTLGLGLCPHRPLAAIDQVCKVDRDRLDLEPIGLDLGEIEDIVDQRAQVAAVVDDGLQCLAPINVAVVCKRGLCEADDRGQRRADLVAHVGEEFRLRPRGRQGLVACGLQEPVAFLDGLFLFLQ